MSPEASQKGDRRLVKTSTPGVYKRGGRYVVVSRDPSGKQRKRAARTLAEARAMKSAMTTDVRRGEWRERSAVKFSDHWPSWIDNYAGRTTRGFRENTRADYRRDLEQFSVPFFGRMKLAAIEPMHVRQFLTKLASDDYSIGSIRNALAPLRAMLADAAEDGIIRSNPAAGVRVPGNAKQPDSRRKNLTPQEIERLRAALTTEHDRLLVDFAIATGLRASEVIALNWEHIDLRRRRVRVTQRMYRGLDVPKSAMSRREVGISRAMVERLHVFRLEGKHPQDDAPVFPSPRGERLTYANASNRVLIPAMRKAGISYGAWHRLRHTTGTELRRRGATLEEIQLHLGHGDLSFTRRTYVHLDADDGPDVELLDDLAGCGHPRRTLRVAL